jgi:hypothetical protein
VQAVKEVVAWQLAEARRQKKISKARMAVLLKTSRTQVDRLLDPKNDNHRDGIPGLAVIGLSGWETRPAESYPNRSVLSLHGNTEDPPADLRCTQRRGVDVKGGLVAGLGVQV